MHENQGKHRHGFAEIKRRFSIGKHHKGVSCLSWHKGAFWFRMMDKRKPTYDLEAFKAFASNADRLNATGAAVKGAAAVGFGRAEIVATILSMQRSHFYKSMTGHADHRIWQDV